MNFPPRVHVVGAWFVVVFALLAHATVRGADEAAAQQQSQQVEEAMAWLDTLGLPDVKGCPFVKVPLAWSDGKVPAKHNVYAYAFVVTKEGRQEVYWTNLTKLFPGEDAIDGVRLWVTPLKDLAEWPWKWKPDAASALDLRKAAETLLKGLQDHLAASKEEKWRGEWIYHADTTLDQRVAIFLFARACRQNGLDDLAGKLIAEAALLPQAFDEHQNPPRPWRELLEWEMGRTLAAQAVSRFGGINISRKELLGDFEGILKRYPHGAETVKVEELIRELRVMVAEDEAHAAAKAPGQPTVEQEVAELIYALRDQRPEAVMSGQPNLFPAAKETAASRLNALGEKAVPQLKLALKDTHLTRVIGGGMDGSGMRFPRVYTVGDCAKMILDKISDDHFALEVAKARREKSLGMGK